MGLVTKPHTFTASTTALSSEVNANFDTLYTLVNGNIEAANIASGAVGEAELAASAVTNAKVSATAAIALSKLAALTATIVPITDASGVLSSSAVTPTELGHLTGVTSAIQTQLNAKAETAADIRTLGFFDTTNDGDDSGLEADTKNFFEVSGRYGHGGTDIGVLSDREVQRIEVSVPAGATLKLKRARFNVISLSLRFRVSGADGTYTSSSSSGEEEPATILTNNSAGGTAVTDTLVLTVRNPSGSAITPDHRAAWWTYFAIE
jgi:hypothetical protein